MDIDTSDKKELRKFGLVMAVAILVLALIRWALHGFHAWPWYFTYVAIAFGVLGLAAPRLLQPVFWAWMKFALAINWVMTHLLLTLAFFLLILPTRIILRLVGNDPLNRAWDPEALSYWDEPEEQPEEFDRYLNQF